MTTFWKVIIAGGILYKASGLLPKFLGEKNLHEAKKQNIPPVKHIKDHPGPGHNGERHPFDPIPIDANGSPWKKHPTDPMQIDVSKLPVGPIFHILPVLKTPKPVDPIKDHAGPGRNRDRLSFDPIPTDIKKKHPTDPLQIDVGDEPIPIHRIMPIRTFFRRQRRLSALKAIAGKHLFRYDGPLFFKKNGLTFK